MKYYKLDKSKEFILYHVGLPYEEEERLRLFEEEKIGSIHTWEKSEVIHFLLWEYGSLSSKFKTPKFCDFHTWAGDFIHNPPLMGQIDGRLWIISPKIKKVMERFKLPDHRFYEAKVKALHSQEIRTYYIFHLLYTPYDKLFYEKITFKAELKSPTDHMVRIFEKGCIRSKEHWFEERRKLSEKYEDYRITMMPERFLYKERYDILWGQMGPIIFNEKVKIALESEDLIGVEIKDWNQYPIITGFERNLKE
ncbi:MAG: hypothetical protein AB8B69_00430 [Chitinophagales bacterium]